MKNETPEFEFVGTCRVCGGNVNKIKRGDETFFACENIKCEYHREEEYAEEGPEWLD